MSFNNNQSSSRDSSRYGSPAMFRTGGSRRASLTARPGTANSSTSSSASQQQQQQQQVPIHQLQQQLYARASTTYILVEQLFQSMLTQPAEHLLMNELIQPSRLLTAMPLASDSATQHQRQLLQPQPALLRSVTTSMQRIMEETERLQTRLFRVSDALGKVQDDIYGRIKLETMSTAEPPPLPPPTAIASPRRGSTASQLLAHHASAPPLPFRPPT